MPENEPRMGDREATALTLALVIGFVVSFVLVGSGMCGPQELWGF